jgi:phosphoribosylanthranilate isomerase
VSPFAVKCLRPQVKVCGLTRIDEAVACAEAGVEAVGCVFFEPSPRCISAQRAREIRSALPLSVITVGVFVDAAIDDILKTVDRAGLGMVQLHGREEPGLVEKLRARQLPVIKALYMNAVPGISEASRYPAASAFLVECSGGTLPGGNARVWNWADARTFCADHLSVLAGGLDPENVGSAFAEALPDAVDVSSGVELKPGRKSPEKVAAFMDNLAQRVAAMGDSEKQFRRIFP